MHCKASGEEQLFPILLRPSLRSRWFALREACSEWSRARQLLSPRCGYQPKTESQLFPMHKNMLLSLLTRNLQAHYAEQRQSMRYSADLYFKLACFFISEKVSHVPKCKMSLTTSHHQQDDHGLAQEIMWTQLEWFVVQCVFQTRKIELGKP